MFLAKEKVADIERHLRARSKSEGNHNAGRFYRVDAFRQYIATDIIDSDIHTTAIGPLQHAFHKIFAACVNHQVCPNGFGHLTFSVATYRGSHLCAQCFGNLDLHAA